MNILAEHALLITAVRHRELVAEAEDYRLARAARRGAAEHYPQPRGTPAARSGPAEVTTCRPYPGAQPATGPARLLRGHRSTSRVVGG